MSLTSRLPHGVKLPATLRPDDARDLITHLAEHYGFAHLLFTLGEVEDHLAANLPTNRSMDRRRLSPDEWERLRNTDAWYHLPTAGHGCGPGCRIRQCIEHSGVTTSGRIRRRW